MKKVFLNCMLLLCALIVGSNVVWATDPELTLDLTSAWTAGADVAGEKVFTKTISETTYTIKGTGATNFKFSNGYFIFGKSGAYIKLPQVDFAVEKIQVIGNAAGSAAVKMNIYVGSTAVSTETTGCGEGSSTGTASTLDYAIGSSYQTANTQYILQVTSAHNAQITYVKYFKKAEVPAGTCATPTFLPTDDAVEQGQEITISCETAGASIYYTMGADPADPTASSTLYNPEDKPTVSAATTIKAIAIKDGMTNSAVGSKDYSIIKVATPTFKTSSGSFLDEQEVEIECATNGATIYYTTATGDATPTDPTSSSTEYTAPFTVTATTSIKAIAIKAHCTNSDCSSTIKYTKETLHTVAEILSGEYTGSGKFVKGYIVGCFNDGSRDKFTRTGATASNLGLADDPDETDKTKVIAVKLASGSAVRTAYNVEDKPYNIGVAQVIAKGTVGNYIGSYKGLSTTNSITKVAEYIKLSELGWRTYSSDRPMDFSGVSTITAYMVTGTSGSALVKSDAIDDVPASTGLLLHGEANATANVPVATSSSTITSSNKLVAGNGTTVEASTSRYVLANQTEAGLGFYRIGEDLTVPVGKAYLDLSGSGSAPSIIRIIDEENNATNIESIEAVEEGVKFIQNGQLFIKKNGVVYDMLGTIVVVR